MRDLARNPPFSIVCVKIFAIHFRLVQMFTSKLGDPPHSRVYAGAIPVRPLAGSM